LRTGPVFVFVSNLLNAVSDEDRAGKLNDRATSQDKG
jgi:hypothetical protein